MKKNIYLPIVKFDTLNDTLHQNSEKVKKENLILEGIFHFENNSLRVSSNSQIKILKRKNISKGKPSNFIALFENNKFCFYISSLYYQDGKDGDVIKYSFDFQGRKYFLVLNFKKRQAKIKNLTI
jgi:hypothetical protein